ncbi:hypothetical protein [Rhizosaccharibacter radicis]|uniref:DUF155 domain-containing protein n=1 Tax=Rhizosaccharibacter radicis TaxID=2782605 RepID=A0ABT1W186_9PROT|nr:hypothetical protein [Acetobacteraceae bacterium KSS12]
MRVATGEIIVFRLFELAYGIDLAQAEAAWRAHAGEEAGRRDRLSATPPKAVAYDVPPLLLSLGEVPAALVEERPVQLAARLFDFGVVSLSVRVQARDLSWPEFCALAERLNTRLGPESDASLWSDALDTLRRVVGTALERPNPAVLVEDYLVGLVRAFDRPADADAILRDLDPVPLLSGETRPLSEGARADLLAHRFSFYTDDLAILTWDRAFIVEPRGDRDVLDVLEVANAQLLEMRYYDELLDDELPRMYDLVEETRRAGGFGSSRRFGLLARRLYALVAEVTELTEKTDNALQVTEDVYLARIYGAALELFRVPLVSAAVDRKLSIIRDTYAALYEEASAARGALMEFTIVILIVIELLLALFRA